ncbi:serine/threonine-protein kinase PknK [Archangium gephyra]|uniref:serine/threonine-protein kinase n=1 Tax=Archangium gephyra TaxID=48 RepID=UPI003B78387F
MHSVSPAQKSLPERVGPYEILGVLGSGGMGVVYRGLHRETGEAAAIKTVRVVDAQIAASIRREIHALGRIQHPNVVRILEQGVFDGLPWYAMELLSGRTLRNYIDHPSAPSHNDPTETSLADDDSASTMSTAELNEALPRRMLERPLPSVLTMLRRLCVPLAYLHGLGVVHRDLKPGNIFIRPDNSVVLMDFGIAGEFGGGRGREVLQTGGDAMGTILYMAPEQIRGGFVDARTDLYALGCIIYECLTGHPPFANAPRSTILTRHLQQQPVAPSQLVEGIPERLDWLVLKLLEKDPENRLGYADDVARMLTELGAEPGQPDEAPPPEPYVYRPVFSGRGNVVRELNAALENVGRGHGELLFLGGGSGAGKTRLAMEMASAANRQNFSVINCECVALGVTGSDSERAVKAPPLHPFRSLLSTVADQCRQWGAKETARLLGPKGKVLAAYEPGLDDLPGQRELPPPPNLPSQAARARVLQSLKEVLFGMASHRPLFLVVDDLQWADELSLGFLATLDPAELAQRGVLVLCTYRMEEMGEELRKLVQAPGIRQFEIGRLDKENVRSMVSGMLALRTPPAEFVDVLERQSEGNPFFIAEYLRAAIEARLLHRNTAGEWVLRESAGSLDTLDLPRSLAEIMDRRLLGLDESTRGLVQLAAVLGREFDLELLLRAAALEDPTAMEALETLRIRQILEQPTGGRLRFVHDKLRESFYRQIPAELTPSLHSRAATAIEQQYAGTRGLEQYFPNLGHHWSRAGVRDRAIDYLTRAGDRARAAYANNEALSLYAAAVTEVRGALEAGGELARWRDSLCHLHESQGDVQVLLGKHEEARASFAESLSWANEDRGRRSRLHRKIGKSWETHHRHDEALRQYDKAEAALGREPGEDEALSPEELTGWWREWSQVQVDRGWVYYWLNRVEEMSALVEKVRPVIQERGTPLQRSRFFQTVATAGFRRERYRLSAEIVGYGRVAAEASLEGGDPGDIAMAHFVLGFSHLFHGSHEEAEAHMLTALRWGERIGDVTVLSRCLTYLTVSYRQRGLVEEARRYGERSRQVSTAGGMDDYLGAAQANLAWVSWREGRREEAEREAQAAVDLWRKLAVVYPYPFQWQGLVLLLAASVERGAIQQGVEHARALIDPKQQLLPDTITDFLARAAQAWDEGRTEQAREELVRGLEAVQRHGYL